ncbi:hypothetical protein AAG570_002912 [Ranatra chinensis]|uniref:Uncharacterized protein n=1 Tax=Ranatra chinensis TaxID=642074 RepID=A0ABD0Y5P4_9HEMI
MASESRNMSYKNKKQETTKIGAPTHPPALLLPLSPSRFHSRLCASPRPPSTLSAYSPGRRCAGNPASRTKDLDRLASVKELRPIPPVAESRRRQEGRTGFDLEAPTFPQRVPAVLVNPVQHGAVSFQVPLDRNCAMSALKVILEAVLPKNCWKLYVRSAPYAEQTFRKIYGGFRGVVWVNLQEIY